MEYLDSPCTFSLETKSEITAEGVFEGYGSVFDSPVIHPFYGRDVIRPGAFIDSIVAKGTKGIKMLWSHNPAEPIGRWLDLAEDKKGLFVRGQLLLDVEKGRDVYSFLKNKVVDGLSIGFDARHKDNEWDAQRQTRTLNRVDLYEVSPVVFPAQSIAKINSVKSLDTVRDIDNIRDYERFLRAVGFNVKEAKQLASAGWSALRRDVAAAADPHPTTGLVTALRDARSDLRRPLFGGYRNARNGPRGRSTGS